MPETKTITKSVRYSPDPRLLEVPAGWHVWNAPRPLFGTLCWEGEFLDGVFYAAIEPWLNWAEQYTIENLRLNASPVRYASQEQAERWLADMVASDAEYREALADWKSWMTPQEIWGAFVQGNAVEVEYTIPV